MARRASVQTEVLFSLAVVMMLASLVLTAVWVTHQEQVLRDLLGRGLFAEARSERPLGEAFVSGTRWWWVTAAGGATPRTPVPGPIDPESLALAARARAAQAPMLQPGAVWDAIRFAAPVGGEAGRVAVARLPREASMGLRVRPLSVIALVVCADVLVFGALGLTLLRRRVIGPLERLAAGAREVAAGARETRVVEEGSREAAEVARAFNEMTASLEARSEALEKAVVDLRGANEELRQARDGLARAERLAAVGQLAAGVAHEIGNPMGAILALLDLAGRDSGLGDEGRGHLERASREGERVRVILRQLLDFSRPRALQPEPVDLAGLAEETLGLVSPQRRYSGVRFEITRDEGVPPVLADRGGVSQILLNLVLNAADAAVSESAEPKVFLHVGCASLQRRVGEGEGEAVAGQRRVVDAVECRVADDGPGIPEELRERIFDPFFTTKDPGQGTGLGLANAARLAEELAGAVELVEPPPGLRTAFALRLPAVRATPARNEVRTAQRPA